MALTPPTVVHTKETYASEVDCRDGRAAERASKLHAAAASYLIEAHCTKLVRALQLDRFNPGRLYAFDMRGRGKQVHHSAKCQTLYATMRDDGHLKAETVRSVARIAAAKLKKTLLLQECHRHRPLAAAAASDCAVAKRQRTSENESHLHIPQTSPSSASENRTWRATVSGSTL